MSISWIVNICNKCNFDNKGIKRFKYITDIPLIDYKLKDKTLTMTCPKCGAVEKMEFNEEGIRIFRWFG